eukprot:scaffold40422_cov72-Phaeocystis_antarctica.AAC.3
MSAAFRSKCEREVTPVKMLRRDECKIASSRRRLPRMLRAAQLKSWKSPKPASITASRCSRSLARKHCALPASKVANCSVSSRRASVWSSSGCAMR